MDIKLLDQKKKILDEYRPFPPDLVKNLEDWFRVELTYTSNALEGNTLTRQETALVVEKGLTVGGKTLCEHLEATNHAAAFDWISDKIKSSPDQITEKDILFIHSLILKGIDEGNSGFYRNVPVRISGSTVILPNPKKVPDLMGNFISWLIQSKELHPIELAIEAHYRLVTIHPFVDGNGRTGRLLMNMILAQHGYPMAILRTKDRLPYITSLEKAQLGGSNSDYIKLLHEAIERSLDIYINALKGEVPSQVKKPKLLKIGQLAQEVGENISTIRYWTQEGLLEVAEVTQANYQLYSREMIERIKKINYFKEKRHTLKEIKALLGKSL